MSTFFPGFMSPVKHRCFGKFRGFPVVRTRHFHCCGTGSIPGWAAKILQAPASLVVWPEKKKHRCFTKTRRILATSSSLGKQHDISEVDHHYVLGVGGQGLEDWTVQSYSPLGLGCGDILLPGQGILLVVVQVDRKECICHVNGCRVPLSRQGDHLDLSKPKVIPHISAVYFKFSVCIQCSLKSLGNFPLNLTLWLFS